MFPNFRSPILSFALNGKLAVYFFFILSGDALISPYLASRKIHTIQQLSIKRYFRLSVPVLLSCALGYFVLLVGMNGNIEAAKILKRQDWLGSFVTFDASFIDVITYSLYDVYFNARDSHSYNPFLWTMSIEMLGSLFVFIFALQVDRLKRPELFALIVAALFFLAKSFYALFFIGVAFSILRSAGFFERRNSKAFLAFTWLLIFAVIFSCIQSNDMVKDGHRTNMLRACVLVFAIHGNGTVIATLESRLSRFLGRLSFPLYLIHFSVLITLTSQGVIYLDKINQLTAINAFGLGTLSVFVCFLIAEVFARLEQRALVITYKALALCLNAR